MMDEREQKMLIECLTRVIEMRADRIRALEAELAAARQELSESQRAKCPICGEDKASAEIGKKLGFRPDIMALELKRLKRELAAARQYPPDMQRPQLEPPPSKNDEARRWADYADYLEKLFVAQNFKLGDAEADIRIALRDLEKCASSLNIDQSGPESISGRLSGFLWAVKQLLAEAKKDSERLDWLENTWGVLAGCVTNLGHGDEWYWRFNWPEDKPGTHGPTVRLAIDAARAAEDNADE